MSGPLFYDRIKESTTSTGTPSVALAGAQSGFQGFGIVGSGNTCYYAIQHRTADEWEVGLGTVPDSGVTLARTSVLDGSSGTLRLNFSAGTKDVFVTIPAAIMSPPVWNPDGVPANAGALDDEFLDDSGGTPSGWTEVDFDGNLTVSEDNGGLSLLQASHAGNSIAGIYKADPTGDITFWTKISISGPSDTGFQRTGLALFQDATTSTADMIIFALSITATDIGIFLFLFNQYNSFNSTVASKLANDSTTGILPTAVYLRIRRNGTTYNFEASTNGVGWQRVHSGTITFTPSHLGLILDNSTTSVDVMARFQFFRSIASDVGLTGLAEGRRK